VLPDWQEEQRLKNGTTKVIYLGAGGRQNDRRDELESASGPWFEAAKTAEQIIGRLAVVLAAAHWALSGAGRRYEWPRLWWGLITTIVRACGFSTATGGVTPVNSGLATVSCWCTLGLAGSRPVAFMDCHILGPLEVLGEGRRVPLAGGKQRALLAVLLLHANETLTTDRLIDELWGESAPATAAKTLQAHICRLRKALPGGEDNGSAGLIATREHGYELRLDPERLDAHRFERLVAEGRSELAAGRHGPAASALEEAISLWRGPPLADLADEPFAQRESARLDDLRVAAIEHLIDAKLALGHHAALVGELEALIAEHPYRERLRAQLMLALYRSERQAAAMQAYQDARKTLVEELGIEPGERLRELQRAILAQDPALQLVAAETPAAGELLKIRRGTFVRREGERAEPVGGPGLLEREAELARLHGLLEFAAAGEGRLLCVEGEAGIGKTALLEALAARALSSGATVLRARGGQLERDFPHGVVRQLYESLVRSEERRRALLRGAAELAAAPLGLSDRAGGLLGRDALLAANHGLYWLTANLAEKRPLVLLVDDAHWVDDATLFFLHYLGRRLDGVAVLAALAWRPAEPSTPRELRDAIRGLPAAELLTPSPLSLTGTATVIGHALGNPPSEAFSLACQEATGGNPFLLRELLRALPEGTASDNEAADEVGRLGPRSISRSVLGRLAVMWPEAVSLARAVAVLETDAELAHAAAVAEIDPPTAAVAADALTDADVLAPGRPLRFAHPIIRRAVYEDLPHGRRGLLHARAAVILEAADEPDRGAVHLLATEPTGDAWAAKRLRAAAGRALSRGSPEAAVALLRRALDEPPPIGERAATLLELGRAARLAGHADAVRHLRPALERATSLAARVEAARELAAALTGSGDVEGAATVLGRTVDALPARATEERFLLEAELLAASTFDDGLARRAADRIDLLLPRISGRSPAERVLLAGAAFHRVAAGTGSGAEVAELVERAIADFVIVDEQSAASLYLQLAVACLLFIDRHERAKALLDAMLADARRSGSPTAFAWVSTMHARFEHVRGNPAAAEVHARSALELFPTPLMIGTELALAYLVFALVEEGRLDDAESLLGDAGVASGPLSRTTSGLTLLLARSALRLDQRRLGEARGDAEEVVRRVEIRGGPLPGRGFRWVPALALNAGGDAETARRLAEQDVKRARAFGVPSVEGIALLVLGVVLGGHQGVRRLEQAVAKLEGAQRRLDHAHALVELGAALRRGNRRSDAREPLRRGMDFAHRCGARPLAERARQELLACGARPRRPVLSGVASLTVSERRVARMAADGMSNSEIAQALFVTRKTVEAHLVHTYRKLEIGSRAELAEALRDAT
jgi:DNA-binding SARP family transcriptional activator/DNA-binding CsgD family transcriptional regulator